MSRLPISMKRPNSARQESPIGIASPASALSTTSTPRRFGQFHHGLGEIAAARVDDVFHAERFEQRALGRAAGAGDHFRAEMLRDLHRRHADAAGAGMHEHALARPHARHVFQRVPRGHEDDRQRRRFFKRKSLRDAPHIAAAGEGLRRQAEDGEAEDAVARRHVRDAFADGAHDAADFVAEDARVRRLAGIERERLQHVAEIHAGGLARR